MLKSKAEINSPIAWMMLILWSLFFVNDLCNRHAHQDNKGKVISHVHYYPDAEEDHNHSDAELLWLDMISNPSIQLVNILNYFEPRIDVISETKASAYKIQGSSFSVDNTHSLRGPPVIS